MLVLFGGAIVESFAVPTVSNLKVTPLPPWGLVVDYDLNDVSGVNTNFETVVTIVADGAMNVAHTLVGDTACTEGSHRVYWNMAADGISANMTNGVVSVCYGWPVYCIVDLSGGTNAANYAVSYCNAPPRGGWTNEVYKTTKLVLKRVEAGSFIMGDDQTDESHRVTLTKPFYMGLYEVTQKQWEMVTGTNVCSSTSNGKGDAYPVHYVSYDVIRGSSSGAKWPVSNVVDADSFLGKLRAKTGNLLFDLPTEAQWEYTCRAGTTTTYNYGDSADGAYMWYFSNSSDKTHAVGTKLSNKWGFYDMHGNVWEWCLDWYWYGTLAYGKDPKGSSSGSDRVGRGGGWNDFADYCTSSYRYGKDPSYGNYRDGGFRLSRTLLAAAGQAEAAGAATVSGVNVDVLADGSVVDGELAVAYLPHGTTNAIVMAGETELIRAQNAGSMTWQPLLSDVPQTLTHAVGKVSLSATYTWTNLVNGFTITYANLRGATHTNSPAQYRKGAEYTFSGPLPKTGYTFTGWTPSAITADMASNVTVTANWRPNRYRIVYDANGGEGSLTTDCLYDEEATLLAKGVSRDGYALLGWALSEDGLLVHEAGATVMNLTAEDEGEVVLYAVWDVAPPKVNNLKVTSLPPWGLAIDYDVNGTVGWNTNFVPVVTVVANGMTNVAQTLMGEMVSANGSHRVYWNMAADGITTQMTNATISVRYEWPTYCVIDLSEETDATTYDVAYCQTPPEEGWTNEVYKTTKLVLKRVEAGSFIMGSDQTNEAHRVTLTKPFYMGLFEVTQKQWKLVMGTNPSSFSDDANPVEQVSYNDIRGSLNGTNWPSSSAVDVSSFLGRLRTKTGDLLFDLPTEAQWEYACRAGTTTTYSYGDSEDGAYMWYTSNSSDKTHEVGTKLPNKWGFYDMHGNVWEWCLDRYGYGTLAYGTDPKGSSSGFYRVLRGGGWNSYAYSCTSSSRRDHYPSIDLYNYGFRLSRTLLAAAGQAEAAGAATVSGVNVDVLADGSVVDGELAVAYLPQGTTNAVVTAGETELIRAQDAGSMTWQPLLSDVPQTLTHAVGDVSLSATYTWTNLVNGFSITYENLKGATHSNPAQYRKGAEYAFPEPTSAMGYTFTGWTPRAITADMASNVTVTANWRANRYRIVYDANGGEGNSTADCLYDEEVTLSAKSVSREGYALLGWAMSADRPLVYEAGANVTNLTAEDEDEVVLYAVWGVVPPKVSNLNVRPLPPWGLVVDYDLNEVSGVNTDFEMVVTIVADGATNVAHTLVGDTACTEGSHRVYWNMAADGISAKMTNGVVSVCYDWPTYCIVDLSGGTNAANYAVSYCHTPPQGGWTNEVYKTTKLVLKRVESGSFIMGSDQTNEAHRVTLTQPFYMGLYEVTQKQWELVMGTNPSWFSGDANPVEQVSYNAIRGSSTGAKWPSSNALDADSFLGKLCAKTGNLLFDLPTEAQWEYACRAGTTTTYSYGDSVDGAYMWYHNNSSDGTKEVGTKLPNKWGFYDMHGNVWEWCLDWDGTLAYGTDPKGSFSGSYRVKRGGSWSHVAALCTSSYRNHCSPSELYGFRLSRTLSTAVGQTGAAGAASVSGVNVDVLAEGSTVDGLIEIGCVPDGEQNAIVVLDGLTAEFAKSSGSFLWAPSSVGAQVLSHAVGTNVLTVTVTCVESATDGAHWALSEDADLIAITLPTDMTSVPDGMLDGCSPLKVFEIPAAVTNIGARAFRGMTSLTSLVVPEGVSLIGEDAFTKCMSLSALTLPSGCTFEGGSTGLSNLTSVVLNGPVLGVDTLRDLFPDAPLQLVTLGEGWTSIPKDFFTGFNGLVTVTCLGTVTKICEGMFDGCSSLIALEILEGVTNIGARAFRGMTSLTSLVVPDSVTHIGTDAFAGCTNLTSLTLPAGCAHEGVYAGLPKLTQLSLGAPAEGLDALRDLFPDAPLESVALGEGWTAVPTGFFDGCTNLVALSLADTVTDLGDNDFREMGARTGKSGLWIQDGWVMGYIGTAPAEVEIPDGVKGIAAHAFEGQYALAAVSFPTSLVSIGVSAFRRCTGLERIDLPEGVTRVDDGAFQDCTYVQALTTPSTLRRVGNATFANTASLGKVAFAVGLDEIGEGAFSNAWRMISVSIPASVTNIGANAFWNCKNLTGVTTPTHLQPLATLFPAAYDRLADISFAAGESALVDGFFEGCAALTEVGIPSGVTALGTGVFRDCAGLLKVALPDGLTVLPDETFAGCSSLAFVVVPASVTTVGANVFSGCAALKSARFLGNAPTVASGAYAGAAADLVTYVADGTMGWDGIAMSRALPETWPNDASNAITTWTPKRMTVTFDAQGGAPATTNIEQTADTTYRLPQPDPTREGATFTGWWSEVEAGAQVKPTTRVVLTGDHAFYAHWRFHEYEIAFDANGGDGEMASVARTFGDGAQALPQAAFTRVDCAFAGWATAPEGEVAFADGAEVADLSAEDGAVVTLYAVWTARTWTAADYLGTGEGVAFGDAGEVPWTPDRETTKDGDGAMRSGAIGAAPEAGGTRATTLTATVVGEGEVSFWWRTSCEPADEEGTFFDFVSFSVDGVVVAQCAGETDWERVTCAVAGAGEHVLAWTFTRDDYDEDESLYDNAAWVDAFTWARSPVVVTFDLGGVEGEAPAAVTNVAGYAISLLDVSALGGTAKRFVGWSDGVAVYAAGATYVFGVDATLTAQWEEKTWTLADAVDAAALAFATGGDADWTIDFATNRVDGASARSGAIAHGQTTWLETTVTGAGELRFWMKVCGERYRNKDCDVGTCAVDGATVYSTATNDWTNVVVSIAGEGAHTIRWAYTKNASRTVAYDCAWVDGVTWQAAQPEAVTITPTGGASFTIPADWFAQYPTLGGTTVSEWQTIAEGNGVKSAPVWHDYVAGTDPTNALSQFTAKIEMKDDAPVVTWSPALNGEGVREGTRVYRVWGKANLDDAAWSEVEAGNEGAYRFFRVTVEMP